MSRREKFRVARAKKLEALGRFLERELERVGEGGEEVKQQDDPLEIRESIARFFAIANSRKPARRRPPTLARTRNRVAFRLTLRTNIHVGLASARRRKKGKKKGQRLWHDRKSGSARATFASRGRDTDNNASARENFRDVPGAPSSARSKVLGT